MEVLPYVAPLALIVCGWVVSRRRWTAWSVVICLAYAAAALAETVAAYIDDAPGDGILCATAFLCCLTFAHRASRTPWRALLRRDGRRLAACRWRLTLGREPLVFYADDSGMTPVLMPKTLADMMAERRAAERRSPDTPERR